MTETQHKEQLHKAGLRATPGRIRLVHVLERSPRPMSAVQIAARLRLNIVSVYRALEALAVAGLVRQGSDGRAARYSYAPAPHHHHLVCSDCGFEPACAVC